MICDVSIGKFMRTDSSSVSTHTYDSTKFLRTKNKETDSDDEDVVKFDNDVCLLAVLKDTSAISSIALGYAETPAEMSVEELKEWDEGSGTEFAVGGHSWKEGRFATKAITHKNLISLKFN